MFFCLFGVCSSWLAGRGLLFRVLGSGFWVLGFGFWVISCGLSVNYCVCRLFWLLVYSSWFMVLGSELLVVKLLQCLSIQNAVETSTSTVSVLQITCEKYRC